MARQTADRCRGTNDSPRRHTSSARPPTNWSTTMTEQRCGNISREELNKLAVPQRHHYVPIWLQRGFTDDNGKLWHADKRKYHIPKSTPPKNLFLKKRMYQVRDPDTHELILDAEAAYSELDSISAHAVKTVLKATATAEAAHRSMVEIDPDMRRELAILALTQSLRNLDKWEYLIKKYVAAGEREHLAQFSLRRVAVAAPREAGQEVVTHLNKLNLSVARTPESATLILGDDPVCLTVHDYYNNKTRPQEGHGVVGMPLDQRTFILWHPGAPDRHNETSLTRLTNRGVRDINRTILDRSNRIAGPDRRSIEALLQAERRRRPRRARDRK